MQESGVQGHLSSLIHGLSKDYELAVAVGEEGFITEVSRRMGARVFVVQGLARSVRLDLNLRAVLGIRQIISDWQPDVVHAHCLNGGLAGRLAARWAGCPSVYTAHGWQFAEGTPKLRRPFAFLVEWLGARLGNAIITVSEYDRRAAGAWKIAKESEVAMIQNGVADRWVPAPVTRNSDEVNLVMVGRFVPQKDQRSLIKACEKMPGAWKLSFVGDGPTMSHAQAEVEKLRLENRIQFLGHRPDVTGILASADVFVLASHYEGLPISILEAMRAGLPVVASNAGGVPECVQHGKSGFLVPRCDSGALRGALSRLIESRQLRSSMGTAGRKLYEDRFTARPMVEETVKVYEAVASPKPVRLQRSAQWWRMGRTLSFETIDSVGTLNSCVMDARKLPKQEAESR
jgi:glycosyltransferase involved in cell wall biosynthesis